MKFNLVKNEIDADQIKVIDTFDSEEEQAIKKMVEVYEKTYPDHYCPLYKDESSNAFDNIKKIIDGDGDVIWERGEKRIGTDIHLIMLEAA